MFGFALDAVIVAMLAGIAAGFVRGLAGFGLSVVLVPVLQLAIDPSAAVLIGLISLLGCFLRATVRWRTKMPN